MRGDPSSRPRAGLPDTQRTLVEQIFAAFERYDVDAPARLL